MPARLYYELHITLEAEPGEDAWANFKAFVASTLPDWRVSKFSEDEVDDYHGKWFMSTRTEQDNYRALLADALPLLENPGYTVLRWKVEDTLLDSKYGDTL